MSITIMAHLIAGYPNKQGFTQAAQALYEGGAGIMELQIPFSDPTADGPVITAANEFVVSQGFQVAEIFDYINIAQKIGFTRIIVMTYANIAFRYGLKRYAKDMATAGVEGLIVPDLPLEDEEGFFKYSLEADVCPIPVLVTTMPPKRLNLLKKFPIKKVYVALRSGITGSDTLISQDIVQFLSKFKKYEIFAGFGINRKEQIKELTPYVQAVVVGSYFTKTINMNQNTIYESVYTALSLLI